MRKLEYIVNLNHFRRIKNEIVPILFTKHQFQLIEKKVTNKKMTLSERNEFSRTISRKMKAVNKISEVESQVFIYGIEKIKAERLERAKNIIKLMSRKFKNKHVFVSGSFLHSEKYNDIDVFVIEKYDKEDKFLGKLHINYLRDDVYSSLFFASISNLCVSNKKITALELKEKVDINTVISIYQELFNDLDRNFKGVKKTLREFILQADFLSKDPIPDSLELKRQVESIIKTKKPKEVIKKIFVKAIILGIHPKVSIQTMKQIIKSYEQISEEYKKYKSYYTDIMQPFKEVLAIES